MIMKWLARYSGLVLACWAYSFQTFSALEVLGAAKMNQIEVNIRDHVHGAAGVAATGIGLITLASGSASGATLDIVMTAYTAYKNKLLVIANLIPSTDAVQLFLRTSTDGGSSYASSAGNYRHAALRAVEAGTVTGGGSSSDTEIELMVSSAVSNTQYGLSGNIYIYDTTNTAVRPRVMFDMAHNQSTEGWTRDIGVGSREAAQDTDAIRLLFASGNIASGTYVLYGFN